MSRVNRMGRLTVVAALAAVALGASAGAGTPDYLQVVRAYADAMTSRGRDTYGREHSPLFATTLDRKTLRLFEGDALKRIKAIPRRGWGIRPADRSVEGANPMHDENLYQVLYALTKITGEKKYAEEADKTLAWFLNHCQSPSTGLFAWGEHLGWDFATDERTSQRHPLGVHEFFRPWVLWGRSFRLAPHACRAFALGVWRHQVGDHDTGSFSREAYYGRAGSGRGSEYPRHGGFFIATWAAAYQHTRDPAFLRAIACLVDSFDRRRHPQSGVIPTASYPESATRMVWPHSNLSLAIDIWDSASRVPAELATKMRRCATRTDEAFLRIPHAPGRSGKGFVTVADARTLQPLRRPRPARSYAQPWATGYGEATDADLAMLCFARHRQAKLPRYRKLCLDTARGYLTMRPPRRTALHPGVMGQVIALMLRAHRLTGERQYLDRADDFARLAIDIFFDPSSPLPRATSVHDHYEAITRADTLAMALLELWVARNRPELELGLVWSDR